MPKSLFHTAAVAALSLYSFSVSLAQSPPDTAEVNTTRLIIVGGSVTAAAVAIHIHLNNAWWKNDRTSFHFQEDLVYAKNVDKVGHFWSGSMLTFSLSRALQWANIEESRSILYGGIASTVFMTYVEVEDGFSKFWGFDRVDFAANVLGAWYPVLQHNVPFMKNFQLKWSYFPKNSGAPAAIPGQTNTFVDDYEGQTYWLSMNMHNLLPGGVSRAWPDWLQLSLGMAVRDNHSPQRYLVWFIAPDVDWTRIIPRDTPFLRLLGDWLNYFHLPMPAVRFSPGVVWYGLYF